MALSLGDDDEEPVALLSRDGIADSTGHARPGVRSSGTTAAAATAGSAVPVGDATPARTREDVGHGPSPTRCRRRLSLRTGRRNDERLAQALQRRGHFATSHVVMRPRPDRLSARFGFAIASEGERW